MYIPLVCWFQSYTSPIVSWLQSNIRTVLWCVGSSYIQSYCVLAPVQYTVLWCVGSSPIQVLLCLGSSPIYVQSSGVLVRPMYSPIVCWLQSNIQSSRVLVPVLCTVLLFVGSSPICSLLLCWFQSYISPISCWLQSNIQPSGVLVSVLYKPYCVLAPVQYTVLWWVGSRPI